MFVKLKESSNQQSSEAIYYTLQKSSISKEDLDFKMTLGQI